jgi:hypothetical protein
MRAAVGGGVRMRVRRGVGVGLRLRLVVMVGMIAIVARSHGQSKSRAHDPVNRVESLSSKDDCSAWFNIQVLGLVVGL